MAALGYDKCIVLQANKNTQVRQACFRRHTYVNVHLGQTIVMYTANFAHTQEHTHAWLLLLSKTGESVNQGYVLVWFIALRDSSGLL